MFRRIPVVVLVLWILTVAWTTDVRAEGDKSAKPAKPQQPAAAPAKPESAKAEQPKPEQSKSDAEDYYELQKLLVDTMDQVERNYVKGISRRELVEAAIQGVLSKLDPYSSYIEPKELDAFRTSVQSEFGGIGIQLDATDDGELKILSPLVDTPAYRAGLQAGDLILEINGKSTDSMTMDEAVSQLKGDAGSEVNLSVIHPGKTDPETVKIKREVIHIATVLGDHRGPDNTWVYMLDDAKKIGYIRITAFSHDTPRELREALTQLKNQNIRALILDLRFNPGGLLPAAIEVCDMFVSEGRIVSTKGRNTKQRVWDAHKEGTFEGFDVTVLVNRYSASASEIVAACLQDHKRAVVIGERTWGKGSVQNVIELEGGASALKLTTASYVRPNGKNIHRFPDSTEKDEWGVMPDDGYRLRMTNQEMTALLKNRRQRDIVQAKPEPTKQDSASPKAGDQAVATNGPNAADPHLRMALEYLSAELARAK